MKPLLFLSLMAALLLRNSLPVLAQAVPAVSSTLEGFDYPYPVQLLPLRLENQDLNLAYMDVLPSGPANGQAVVLLHGKNFGGFYFQHTIEVLAQAGYRVVVPDQLGFGRSSRPNLPYSFHELARNTKQLLDQLGLRQVVLLGHSTGGMLATRFAIEYPDVVTALVLEDPIGMEDYRLAVPYTTPDALYQEELTATDAATRKYLEAYFVTWQPAYEVFVRMMNGWKRSAEYPRQARVAALTTTMIYEQPVCYEYARVRARTLILVGREDRTVIGKAKVPPALLPTVGQFPALAKKTAGLLPHASFVVIESSGHIPHLEQAAVFHREVLRFLGAR